MSIGLYAHIPFCARRCDYCDFFVVVASGSAHADFFEWLLRDLAAAAARLSPVPPLGSLYLGGGTPSYVPPDRIARLLDACGRLFPIEAGIEITIEANPESVTAERAEAWRSAGINRLSLGAQSFEDAVLAPRGRLHDAEGIERAAAAARRAGFDNLGIDLIAGLPGETIASFAAGLDRLVALEPEHASIYLLELGESGKETPLSAAAAEGRVRPPDEETCVAMYEAAAERLPAAGLRHYEISNFARRGLESRHNLRYWTGAPYLGIGPSSHSHLGGRRFARPADLAGWREFVAGGSGEPDEDYTLEPGAAAREALVMGLRLIDGVETEPFSRRWGAGTLRALAPRLDELEAVGLVSSRGGRIRLTSRGLLLSNEVFARLT